MHEETKRSQPKSGSRLIFDIAPPTRLKELSRELLVPKVESKKPLLSYLRFGWRFALVLVLSVWWTTGVSPFDIYRQSLLAINGGTEYVSLYAQNVTVEEAGLGIDVGWQSVTEILDEPDLSPEASALEFSPENSAVWKGDETHLKLSNFRYPELEVLTQTTVEDAPVDKASETQDNFFDELIYDEEASSTDLIASSSEAIASSSEEEIIATSTEPIATSTIEVATSTEEAELEVASSSEEVETEEATSTEEIYSEEVVASTTDEVASSSEEVETDEGGLLSYLWNKIKALSAKAQNELFPVRKLNDIGYFESASLKLSLAVIPIQDETEMEASSGVIQIEDDAPVIASGSEAILPQSEATSSKEQEDDSSFAEEQEASSSPAVSASSSVSWFKKLFSRLSANAETNYADFIDPKLSVWYRIGPDDLWHQVKKIHDDKLDNLAQGAFMDIELPLIDSWTDVEQLEIRLKGHERADVNIFIDAAWVDADFIPTRDLPQSKQRAKWEQALELISKQTDFSPIEIGELRYKYRKQKESLLGRLSANFVDGYYWQDINIEARLINADGIEPGWPLSLIFANDGEFTVLLPELPRDFKPGRYQIHFSIIDSSGDEEEVTDFYQDFNWGVLALNTNKTIYRLGEQSYLQLAVLDNNGNTVCDADMSIEIISPSGDVDYLTTDNSLISRNPACGRNNVISKADYFAYYDLEENGEYEVKVLAYTLNGARAINDSIVVSEEIEHEIERSGPTRINPKSDYEVSFEIQPNQEYDGYFHEYLPKSFTVTDQGEAELVEHVNKWELRWNQEFLTNEIYNLSYRFQAPLISPEFYLLGPAELDSFTELRQWQVAADAPGEIEHYFKDYGDLLTIEDLNYTNQGWTNVSEYQIPAATFTAGDKYLLVVNFSTTATSSDVSSMAHLRHGSTEFAGSRFIWDSRQATDTMVGHAYNYTTVWEAVDTEDIEIDVSVFNATSSVWVEGFQAYTINLSDDVQEGVDWYYDSSSNSGLSTLYTAGADVEINGQGKDWMIITMAHVLSDSDGPDFAIRVYDETNSVSYNQGRYEMNGADDERPLMMVTGANFSGTSTWQIEGTLTAVASGDWDYHSVFALNLGKFRDRYIDYNTTYVGITPIDTWVEADGINPYLVRATGDQVIWSEQVVDVGDNAKALYNRIQVDGTTVPTGFDDIVRGLPQNSTDENLHHNFYLGSLTMGNRDIDVDMYETNDVVPAPAVDIHNLLAFSMMLKAPPTSDFNSVLQDRVGSGTVAINIEVDDPDDDYCQAQLEYVSGTLCDFSSPNDPTLDEATTSMTLDYGTLEIDNEQSLQIGSTTLLGSTTAGLIKTASGSNSVAFEWTAVTDLPDVESDYCLRLTVRDSDAKDQTVPATTTVYIDTIEPTAPGALSLDSKTSDSVVLSFGAASTETNFKEYKIFYATTSPVTINDYMLGSSTDADLGDILFDDASTTTIAGLATSTTYYFQLFAFDDYGNSSSSVQELTVTTNFAPAEASNLSQNQSGNGTILNGGWVSDSGVDLVAEVTDQDDTDEIALYFELIASSSVFTTATTVPAGACASTTAYTACATNIWHQTSLVADYQTTAYRATVTPASIPDSAEGYKWQVLACDDYGECSSDWAQFNGSAPNFRTDYTAPTDPGALSLDAKTNQSITLNFGATTTENNFLEYKIFYIEGAGVPTELDNEWNQSNDINLANVLFSDKATTTVSGLATSTQYTFNIWAYDQAGNLASATPFSAWTNLTPLLPDTLGQFETDKVTAINLGQWHTESSLVLSASSTDIDLDIVNYYFELLINTDSYTIATTVPVGACISGEAYADCVAKIWTTTVGTTSITSIPDLDGYKWQVMACDYNKACSEWTEFNAETPHFKLDATAPTVPGNLTEIDSTGSTIMIGFGATTTESYFEEYKIYYSTSTPVLDTDYVLASSTDIDLGDILFNDTATTVLTSLEPDTEYNISIWAYDQAGNSASSAVELIASTTYIFKSFNWRWYHDEFNETPIMAAAQEDTAPTNISKGSDVKLRIAVGETDGVVVEDTKLRLQYSSQADFSSDVHFVAEISSSTSLWTYGDGIDDDDDLIGSNLLSGIGDRATHNESGISVSTYDYNAATSTEFEFTIRNNLAPDATTYYFRAYEERKSDAVIPHIGEMYPSLVTEAGSLSYSISGVGSGITRENVTTDITTTANSVPFGTVLTNDDAVAIHNFTVNTNANNGYQLFVYERQNLLSAGGASISNVSSDNASPAAWPGSVAPSAWGYHTSDDTLSGASPSRFAADNSYAYFETLAKEVSYSPIPVASVDVDLVYRLEVSELQEAGEYETEIVYILVPTF